ncbi:MAG: CPBP family intramembrane metalloprotease [Ignavibacteriales bacterium]|nr:CPBP family intramembrane metalloprotease [Ignavibacteriales bacterium]
MNKKIFLQNNFDNNNELYSVISPTSAAFVGLVIVFILYQFIGGFISLTIFGTDIKQANLTALRLFTIAGQILFILLPALILTRMIYFDISKVIRFNKTRKWDIPIFTLGLIFLFPLIEVYLFLQNALITKLASSSEFFQSIKNILDELDKLIESSFTNILVAHNPIEFIFVVLVVCVTPAICEEVFFRGYIQKSFELKLKAKWGIFLTALFFGLYHFNPYATIPLIALGLYFGYAIYKTNSIFVVIILHFLTNFFSTSAFQLLGSEEIMDSEMIIDSSELDYLILFSILLVIFSSFIYFVNRYYKKKNEIKQ